MKASLGVRLATVMGPQMRPLRRKRLELVRPVAEPDVEIRCLADYDTALGLDEPEGEVA